MIFLYCRFFFCYCWLAADHTNDTVNISIGSAAGDMAAGAMAVTGDITATRVMAVASAITAAGVMAAWRMKISDEET